MTTTNNNTPANPIITVPLHKGVHRNQRISEDFSPLSSTHNPKLQAPFDKRRIPNPEYQSHVGHRESLAYVTAPPVPVRVGKLLLSFIVRSSKNLKVIIVSLFLRNPL